MATVTLKGNTVNLEGSIPEVGASAPDFKLVKQDLSETSLKDYNGKVKVLLTVPSLDTGICAIEAKTFNAKMGGLDNVVVLVASGDLPFAMARYCAAEGVENGVTGSEFRDANLSKAYGVHIADGGLKGLSARAVFVMDKDDKITYKELVPEITQEPNYDSALEAVQKLS